MSLAEQTTFEPTHFAICRDGRPMPCTIINDTGEWLEVASPGGKSYTYHVDSVIPADAAREMLAKDRVDFVLTNYSFKVQAFGTDRKSGERFTIVKVNHPSQGRRTYRLLVGEDGSIACDCPSAASHPRHNDCKHCRAAHQLIEKGALNVERPVCLSDSAPECPAVTPGASVANGNGKAGEWFDPTSGEWMPREAW